MIGTTSYMAAVTHISVHPTGGWVFTAHFNSGHVAVSPVGATGAAGAVVDIERPANEAHQIVSDASGRHVFVPVPLGQRHRAIRVRQRQRPARRRQPAPGAGRDGGRARATSRFIPTSSPPTSSTSSTARSRRTATTRTPGLLSVA
jgi:hypothetical protein